MITKLVIFGASGDLTSRYLMPALAQLETAGHLPKDLEVIGTARDDWDTHEFRRRMGEALQRHAADIPERASGSLISRLSFRPSDITEPTQAREVVGERSGPIVAYLALPPFLFPPAVEALQTLELPHGSRIVVEKPFGEDLRSARKLNALLHRVFPENATFRMDHFLGHQTVQNILGLRFANRIFEPVWSHHHIERVEITWDETLRLEGRAGYYDSAGALKDMIQNHLLQLLCLVAMEPPPSFNERDLRDHKVAVLRCVRAMSRQDVQRDTLRARYAAARIGGRRLPSYADEEGVDSKKETETFAQVTLRIDNWRWSGTPFVLRTGKALAKSRREILVHFHSVPHLPFAPEAPPTRNVLRMELNPDRLALLMNINGPGDPFDLECIELDRDLAPQALSPYARILMAVFEGDPTLSIRDDEAEECWRIVEPILTQWKEGQPSLLEYPAGSDGPA
jgi:glucose-6-phosphate 1-dehydrogenase